MFVVPFLVACGGRPPEAPAAVSATTTQAPSTSPASAPLSPRDELPGLRNFAQVSPVLYRGAQPTREGFETLRKLGVRTVVSLRWLHSDRELLAGTGLRYTRVAAKAWHPEDEDVARVLKVIEDPSAQPVFVHCEYGADRTGVVVASYRIVAQGWTAEDAAKELPRFRFHPIWTQIIDYLRRFDREAMRRQIDAAPMLPMEVVP